MASALTDKLSRLVKHISGQARITETNVADMLREWLGPPSNTGVLRLHGRARSRRRQRPLLV
jgi:hypothetical protein